MKSSTSLGLLAAALLASALAPAAGAVLQACAPVGNTCATHAPYSGSLYCDQPWSSGYGGEMIVAYPNPATGGYASVTYWCFNWSNYGENVWRFSWVFLGANAAGHYVNAGFEGNYETYYENYNGPYYRDDCFVFYSSDLTGGFHLVECHLPVAPWGTAFSVLYQNHVSVNADCGTDPSAPTVQVCLRGDTKGYDAGFSACDRTGDLAVKALGTRYESGWAGIASCLVAQGLLGP